MARAAPAPLPPRAFPPPRLFQGQKVLLMGHRGADVDAAAAAAFLHIYLEDAAARADLAFPEHVNVSARKLLEHHRLPYTLSPRLEGYDALFLLDLNEAKMLGDAAEQLGAFQGARYVVDHHEDTGAPLAPAEHTFRVPDAVSTTYVLYELLRRQGYAFSPLQAELLAAGIITDSAHFLYADVRAFEAMVALIRASGKPFQELLHAFLGEASLSERVARLKAASRARFYSCGEMVLAASQVGAFEAQAAGGLVRLGADIAFVAGFDEKTGATLCSGRASHKAQKAGFNLVEHVFAPLQARVQGDGGGHAGAAAFTAYQAGEREVLEHCVRLARAWLHRYNPRAKWREHTD